MVLGIAIVIDVPMDIVRDGARIRAVEDGLVRSISKGLYDRVSFRIGKTSSKIK